MNTLLEIFPGLTDVMCVLMAFCLVACACVAWAAFTRGMGATSGHHSGLEDTTEVQ